MSPQALAVGLVVALEAIEEMQREHDVSAPCERVGEIQRELVCVRQSRQRVDERLLFGERERFGDPDDPDAGKHDQDPEDGSAEKRDDPGTRPVERRERGRHDRDQEHAEAQCGRAERPLGEAHTFSVGGNPGFRKRGMPR